MSRVKILLVLRGRVIFFRKTLFRSAIKVTFGGCDRQGMISRHKVLDQFLQESNYRRNSTTMNASENNIFKYDYTELR